MNDEEGFKVYIKSEEDLSGMEKKISLELGCLLELLANNQIVEM